MFKRKLLMAGLALAILGVILLTTPRQPERTWTLPDGSTLRLVKVTWGTKHVCRYGNRFGDFLYPLVPARYRTNYNFQVASFSAPSAPSLVVWIERVTSPTNIASQPFFNSSFFRPVCRISVFDESGVESVPEAESSFSFGTAGSAARLHATVLRHFPQRTKWLGIRVYPPFPFEPTVSNFRVRNPARQSPPNWSAEQLPATRSINGLRVTMLKLVTGLASQGVPGREPRCLSRASFAVQEDGQTSTNLSLTRIVLRNAAGEEMQNDRPLLETGQRHEAIIDAPLWLEEPAWRVTAEFARTAEFSPEHLWKISGVPAPAFGQSAVNTFAIPANGWVTPVPAPGPSAQMNIATNIHGIEVKLVEVRWTLPPSGVVPMEEFSRSRTGLTLVFEVPTAIWLTGIEWSVERRGGLGRTVKRFTGWVQESSPRRSASALPTRRLQFVLDVPDDTKSLNATLGVSTAQVVEFCVKPGLAETNAGSAR